MFLKRGELKGKGWGTGVFYCQTFSLKIKSKRHGESENYMLIIIDFLAR